jgi:hypothetical protein
MHVRKLHGLVLILVLLASGGCWSRPWPPLPGGVTWRPGHYLKEYYIAPEFAPEQTPCHLAPFTLEEAQGLDGVDFLALFQAELARAWEANGLKTAPEAGPCRLSGAIHLISIGGQRWRFFLGRLTARLVVSGAITRKGETLFAFQDQASLASPINPGPAAPRETELLLRQLSRDFAHRLLDELLLHGLTAEGG